MDDRFNPNLKLIYSLTLICILTANCGTKKPSSSEKIFDNKSKLNAGIGVQIEELLKSFKDSSQKGNLKLYNPFSVLAYYKKNDFKPAWSSEGKFKPHGDSLKNFIDNGCKFFGLLPKAYHNVQINELYTNLKKDSSEAQKNAELWAKADVYLTDALFQIAKHVKNGRLYEDTNYRFFDTSITNKVFLPIAEKIVKNGASIPAELEQYEPNFHDYDSIKLALKKIINASSKNYTTLIYPYTDSLKFYQNLVKRIKEEGLAKNLGDKFDSVAVANAIIEWQNAHGNAATGKVTKDLITSMNFRSSNQFERAALSMDKFKDNRIKNNGDYVLVNIPSYMLRAYSGDTVAVESKVAVGKTASKTPVMESEISDIILMPLWYVPPSILKIPGWLERHKKNPNFIVRGKTAVQKSGPGNALGEIKFNFKSGDAIYLHDTNEKWAFSSNYRAVSHGCVRVQQYKKLAQHIANISPICEKNYIKKLDKMIIDSVTGDTNYKYKYVVKDSVIFRGDTILGMLKKKVHRELKVEKKVPIYIEYFTCAARNGNLVFYPDVYGIDKQLLEKYF